MRVAAVVLAAGASRRMGRPKMALPFAGSTILETVLDRLAASPVDTVTVVLRPGAEEMARQVAGRGMAVCVNPRPEEGMLSSAQHGLEHAPADADGYLFVLGDQPGIEARVVDALIAAAESSSQGVFVPVCDGRRGHPLLARASYRQAILDLPLDAGLNQLARRYPADVEEVTVDLPAIHQDLDTPEDYQQALRERED